MDVLEEARTLGAEFRLGTRGKVMVRNFERLPEGMQVRLKEHISEIRRHLTTEAIPYLLSQLVLAEAELILVSSQPAFNCEDKRQFSRRGNKLQCQINDIKHLLSGTEVWHDC